MRAFLCLFCALCLACVGQAGTEAVSSDPISGLDGGLDGRVRDATPKSDADNDLCRTIRLPTNAAAPSILLVQDRSGSMLGTLDPQHPGPNRWLPSLNALAQLTSALNESVAFGLMLFPATSSTPGAGPVAAGCDQGKLDVEVALESADAIEEALARSTPDVGATPTATTLKVALAALQSCTGCRPGAPKYVVLVTDGQPTCGASSSSTLPEDIEATNAAIDALRVAGITTYAFGYDTAGDPAAVAALNGFAMHGGTDAYRPVENGDTLLNELSRVTGALVPCDYLLDSDVDDPTFMRVEIDGVTYPYQKDWQLRGRTVSLEGTACATLRDARLHQLAITYECEPIIFL